MSAISQLRARREALGLTLRDVEAITEGRISNPYLSQLENGRIKRPSLTVALQLAATYAVSVETVAAWIGAETVVPVTRFCSECGRPMP
jgi:transcriptional regulator with XRE-family HTH domain